MFFVRPDLTTEEIEKRVDDYTLFKYYCPNFKKINIKFGAEFRKDKDPSASITYYNHRLWYKDFGDPLQERAYNIYSFIMRKYSLSFIDSLKRINSDFNLGLGYNSSISEVATVKHQVSKQQIEKEEDEILSEISVKKIKMTDRHYRFWTQYDIPKEEVKKLLQFFKVYAISHFWLKNTPKIKDRMFVVNDIGFTYDEHWHGDIFLRKIYLPRRSGSVFYTNCNKLVTQGYEQLPKTGDLVFVTSSKKDLILLRYLGFYAVAPSNENVFIQEHIFEDLKKRFKRIVIFYDNDYEKKENWGVMFAKKHSEKYNIPYMVLPDNTGKDPSDFSKKYGSKELKQIIDKKLEYVTTQK